MTRDWDTWLGSLDEPVRSRAEHLRDAFARLGADDPEGWAGSEMREDIAQLTRFLFLAAAGQRMQDAVGDALDSDAGRGLVEGGTDEALLDRVVRTAVASLAFNLCYLLDEPDGTGFMVNGQWVPEIDPGDRRWMLCEIEPDGTHTGRDVGGLHESLSEVHGEEWITP